MHTPTKVLIVEDEVHALTGLAELISGWGYRTETARDGIEGYEKVLAWDPAIVVTDLKMPRLDGIGLLTKLTDIGTKLAVVVLTAQGSVELAVDAMKLGAYDFIPKPVDATRLKTILANATRQLDTELQLEVTRRQLRQSGVLGALVGHSRPMQEVFGVIERIAPSNVSVLITGESGTGKELVARTLHNLSERKASPFVAVNCAAIPETLMESEIFGHEKGAFTGAVERRAGCFELAEEGTLLLDELAEMPIGTQAKLLRVLEERKLRRLGARTEQEVDVRVLAATNRNPEEAVAAGQLRSDLFYRLNVFHIHMPPLREHPEDIPDMVEAMLAEMNMKHGRRVAGISSAVLERLEQHDWPGNARELRNLMERAVILAFDGGLVEVGHLPSGFGRPSAHSVATGDGNSISVRVGATVGEAERLLIVRTLEFTGQNKTRAAEMLGVSLKTLHNKLKEYETVRESGGSRGMSLKTKLVLAITSLVFLVTAVLSLVYVSHLLQSEVEQSYDANKVVAEQIRLALQQALETGLKGQKVDPNDPVQLRALVAQAVRDDLALKSVVDSVNRYVLTIYDVTISDNVGHALLTTGQGGVGQPIPIRPNYQKLRDSNALDQLRTVLGPPQVYDVVLPLTRNGEPFATVHVGVRTTLLREQYAPKLNEALTLMGLALGTALIVAFLLGNLALRPMEELSMQLDYWTPLQEEQTADVPETDTVLRVSNKIERIGQRMRNVEEIFSTLKENLDQVLGNLQDGILLFTGDGRAVLVSNAVRRFLNVDRNVILGAHARDIFDRNTVLGKTVRDAWDAGLTLVQEEIVSETGNRIEVSLDFIHDDRSRQGLGALLTLHDLESVEVIESQLELSRRMAAIGRLTSGVGHEVKNPINAIVVHLELLKTKLGNAGTAAKGHLEVIDSEIHRLDRVVQTLVDFSRPVEVKLLEYDLRHIIADVVTLAAAEMSTRNVTLVHRLPSYSMVAKVDVDLLKQAIFNVVQNGAQAMPHGGLLEVVLEEDGKTAVIRVEDEGEGISEELRERIFDLYFTTKSGGSGIGLAMTYRILQLHHGSIDVQSEVGRGSVFQLRIPLSSTDRGRRHPQPALLESVKGLEG